MANTLLLRQDKATQKEEKSPKSRPAKESETHPLLEAPQEHQANSYNI